MHKILTNEGIVNDEDCDEENDGSEDDEDVQKGRIDGHDDPKGARTSVQGSKIGSSISLC